MLFLILECGISLACDYLDQFGCKDDQRCIYLNDPKTPICLEKYVGLYLKIHFPFSSTTVVTCDQGPHMAGEERHSHAWFNSMDALDFRTDETQAPAKVYSGLSGTVSIYESCNEFNTQCGNGFGNQVKIFNEDGYLVFYAHLEKVFVRNGDKVIAGLLIGVEVNTGWTGQDNRHLHFSVHYEWREKGIQYWSKLGWLPRSIPFRFDVFKTISGSEVVTESTKTVKCIRRKENKFFEAALRGTISR